MTTTTPSTRIATASIGTVATGFGWACPHCLDHTGPVSESLAEAGYLAGVHDQLWHGGPSATPVLFLESGGAA